MRYIPWKKIDSWSCITCGGCCREFLVILSPYEYARFSRSYGLHIMHVDEHGNSCLKFAGDRCLFQDAVELCALQPLGMKPLACKMWPFAIRRIPIPGCGDALFQYKGEEYHVYVDRYYPCPGIGKGVPAELSSTIAELIEIWRDPLKRQIHSTSIHGAVPKTLQARSSIRLIS